MANERKIIPNEKPIYAQIKITGEAAERIKLEAIQRRISLNSLISEYAIAGMQKPGPDDDALAGVEKRLVNTMISMRSDIDETLATVNVLAAFVDGMAKSLFTHLPPPSTDSREAIAASAIERYEKLIKNISDSGFDNQRPRAIQNIVDILSEKLKRDVEAAEPLYDEYEEV